MSVGCHDPDLDVRVKKATERISENMHIIANEPSLAFYRLQEHVRKVMPSMVQKRMEVSGLHQDLQGCCYDVEYALSAVKAMEKADVNFQNTQALLKNAVFLRQQLKYEESRRNKKDPQSAFKRLSAHITLDLPDLPDALRETANKVESIMAHARQGGP
ncbi:UNVERIFIED_CONTAM: hypothetical protein PYX00_005481 [Menopon gallinae]|uniref:BLOC-1-related complex subunit 8 n=1 Tax=Menopon gallinae TaxID=328185 RepID=A0AAW2HT84_9NEOP